MEHVWHWKFPYKRFEYFRASVFEILHKTLLAVEIKWLHHEKAIAKYEPTETFLKLLLDPHFASVELICIPIAPWVILIIVQLARLDIIWCHFFNQLHFGVIIKVSFIVYSSPLCNLQGSKDLVNVGLLYFYKKGFWSIQKKVLQNLIMRQYASRGKSNFVVTTFTTLHAISCYEHFMYRCKTRLLV